MASIGFNARDTAGFVVDGAGETYLIGSDTYPTVRAGWTFGYTASPSATTDRDNAVDARLAGVHTMALGFATLRVDLPAAGEYVVRFAMGDSFTSLDNQFSIKDTATLRIAAGPDVIIPASGHQDLRDVLNAEFDETTWPSGNSLSFATPFATTVLNMVFGSSDDNGRFKHLFISQVSVTPAATAPLGAFDPHLVPRAWF